MKITKKYDAGDIAFFVVMTAVCLWIATIMVFILIYFGQQLVWQLRRTDCGLYTVNQDKTGDIPMQCVQQEGE